VIGFLTVVTVAFVLVLVVVVAVSLIIVGRTLWSVGTTLGKIAGGLKVVERQTAPLAGYVDALNEGLSTVKTGLTSVAGHLSDANDELAMAMGEPVAGQPTSNVA
jgi:uncharacterized protein YoxC